MTPRILLLAPLDEPLTEDARGSGAAAAFELASALAVCVADTGELAVDLVACRGSRTGLPLIGVDPSELAPASGRLAAEALLTQVALSGLADGYHVIHSLVPAIGVLQIASAQGAAIVQTVADRHGEAAAEVLARLVDPRRLAQVRDVPLGVDLTRFLPAEDAREDCLVWIGRNGTSAEATAHAIASALGLPLANNGDAAILQHARALLHLAPMRSPFDAVWPLRALACGTPILGWSGMGLESLAPEPLLGALAPRHDVDALIARAAALPDRRSAAAARRALALARHGARAMVGRYREIYRELTSGP
jgi:hypothetical protein